MFLLNGGLLAAALILSIKTGLVLGASRLGAGALILTAACFGGGLFLLTVAFAGQQLLLVDMLDRYTFTGALLMALALIFLGLQGQASSVPKNVSNRARLSYLLGFLPCPFCMIALAFSVIVMAPLLGAGVTALGSGTAAVFTLLAIAAAFAGRKLIGAVKWNPTAVFNHLLFFMGVLTLAFALTIPNFVQAMAMPTSPVEVPSPEILGASALTLAGFALAGYFRQHIKFRREG